MAMAQYKVTQCSRRVCVYVRVVDVFIIILSVAPASPRLLLLVDWRCVVVAVVVVVDYDTIHTLLLSLLFYFLLCVAKRSVHSKREHLLLLLLLFLPLFSATTTGISSYRRFQTTENAK